MNANDAKFWTGAVVGATGCIIAILADFGPWWWPAAVTLAALGLLLMLHAQWEAAARRRAAAGQDHPSRRQ